MLLKKQTIFIGIWSEHTIYRSSGSLFKRPMPAQKKHLLNSKIAVVLHKELIVMLYPLLFMIK